MPWYVVSFPAQAKKLLPGRGKNYWSSQQQTAAALRFFLNLTWEKRIDLVRQSVERECSTGSDRRTATDPGQQALPQAAAPADG